MGFDDSKAKKLGFLILISFILWVYFFIDSRKFLSETNEAIEEETKDTFNHTESMQTNFNATRRVRLNQLEHFMYDISLPPPSYSGIYSEMDPTFPALAELCNKTKWRPGHWLRCGPYRMGLFNAKNRVQNCIALAIEAGLNVALGGFHSRTEDNVMNLAGPRKPFNAFFDDEWLKLVMSTNCPQMMVNTTISLSSVKWIDWSSINPTPKMKELWDKVGNEPGWFNEAVDIALNRTNSTPFMRVNFDPIFYLRVHSQPFELQYAWGNMIRYRRDIAKIADEMINSFNDSYGAVHWRFESDFTGFEMEMMERFNMTPTNKLQWPVDYLSQILKPGSIVYIACGEKNQTKILSNQMEKAGYVPFTKFDWALKKGLGETFSKLEWDIIAMIDYLALIRSTSMIGIEMSTFSLSAVRTREVFRFKSLGFNSPTNTLLLGQNPPRRNETFWW